MAVASMDNYIPLLMIPLGALLYLAISGMSDLSILNRGVNVRFDDAKDADTVDVDRRLVYSVLHDVARANNRTLAVKCMPVTLVEFTDSLSREIGREVHGLSASLINLLYEPTDSVTLHNDFICMSDNPHRDLCARALYENAMGEGSLRIKENIGIERFMALSGALCYNTTNLRALRKVARKGPVKVCTCGREETRSLEGSESLCCKGNALLLFLRLNDLAEVVEC